MSRKIVVGDKVAPEGVEFLRTREGFEVDFAPGLPKAELAERLRDAEGLIVRSGVKVDADLMDAAPNLRVVGRAGIGVDNIDLGAATARGVVVLNTPDANATTTAELAIAHLLSLSRHLPQADASLKSGAWARSTYVGVEVAGKTVGVVGFGSIGRLVATRCKALGLKVLAYDPFVTEEVFDALGVEGVTLDQLTARADYVTLHCPITDATRGLFDEARIASMKPGARLINCARGGLIDEAALAKALETGHLAGAALDVFESEPPGEHPLFHAPNLVVTPHLGASTHEAQVAVGVEIARAVVTYLESGEALTSVNVPPVTSAEASRLRPYQDLARSLGRLTGLLTQAPVQALHVARAGRAAELGDGALAREALVGLFDGRLSAPVNRISALHVAEEHGLSIVESQTSQGGDYATLLSVTASTSEGDVTVEGTLYDEKHPRLVRLAGRELEAFLEGHLLLTRHSDQPGVVGQLGQLLGQEDINISRMQVSAGEESAWAVLEISQPLSRESMEKLSSLEAIQWVTQVSL